MTERANQAEDRVVAEAENDPSNLEHIREEILNAEAQEFESWYARYSAEALARRSFTTHLALIVVSHIVLGAASRIIAYETTYECMIVLFHFQLFAIAFHGHVVDDFLRRSSEYRMFSYGVIGFAAIEAIPLIDHSCLIFVTYLSIVAIELLACWLLFVIFNQIYEVRIHEGDRSLPRKQDWKPRITIREMMFVTSVVAVAAAVNRELERDPLSLFIAFFAIFLVGTIFFGVGLGLSRIIGCALRREPISRVRLSWFVLLTPFFVMVGYSLKRNFRPASDEFCFFLLPVALGLSVWLFGTVLWLRRHVYTIPIARRGAS